MTTIERTTTGGMHSAPRRRGLIALVAVLVVIAASVVIWMMTTGDEDKTSTQVMQDLAAAMRDDDIDKVNALLVDSGPTEIFVFSMALKAEPTLSDCVERGGGGRVVSCDLTFGDDYFYSQVAGETQTSKISGTVTEDGTVQITSFDRSSRMLGIEAELRPWVEQNRPELYDQMFDEQSSGQVRADRKSGELRMELMDEFMASR